jgi:hypothetical protein
VNGDPTYWDGIAVIAIPGVFGAFRMAISVARAPRVDVKGVPASTTNSSVEAERVASFDREENAVCWMVSVPFVTVNTLGSSASVV